MKIWKTTYADTEIAVVNSLVTTKLQVNGKTQDVYWGLFAFGVRLYGSLKSNGDTRRIKAVMGAKLLTWDCAIFVDDEAVFSSTDT
ncbi:MAG: hypothetical protein IIC50_15710 [Planctomycetes bacterium]|nr:hypothetical protein [Planctomycetota bacterium]